MRACVDIGGTKIAISLADASGWRWRESFATPKTGPRETIANAIVASISKGAAALDSPRASVNAVGVSSCGPFRRADGQIELFSPNICGVDGNDWQTVPLERGLRQHFATVNIENDAVAALKAEMRWGALGGVENCAYVTWSTGVGFGLCVDGRTVCGKHGNAGHAGHSFVAENETSVCGCGNRGDLESLVSGSALERQLGHPAAKLFQLAAAGDSFTIRALELAAARFSTALYNVAVTLDLSVIAIGGSVFLGQQDWLLPRIRANIATKSRMLADGLTIVPAGLGQAVGDFGALSLVASDDWTWMPLTQTPHPRPSVA
jgi:glucokinase